MGGCMVDECWVGGASVQIKEQIQKRAGTEAESILDYGHGLKH